MLDQLKAEIQIYLENAEPIDEALEQLRGEAAALEAQLKALKATSFSRGSSQPRDRTRISCIGRRILYH